MTDLESGRWQAVDPDVFRATLGHFPTGVVLVTSLDGAGEPVGMVVGSFTSVSLDPPLVAFLPSRSSQTYARLRGTREIVVNVLSAEQEWICRRFASKTEENKWDRIRTSVTESGVPVLDEAVVSIHCEVENTVEAGDHDIVIGRVVALRMGSRLLPLLFFQGGYGRFTPSTLVAPTVARLVEPIRQAELARPGLERVAAALGVECAAVALVDGSVFTLASIPNPASELSPPTIGRRVPFLAPIAPMFVADQGAQAIQEWLGSLAAGSSSDELRSEMLDGLARARQRGYSVVLESKLVDELDRAADDLSDSAATVSDEAHYRSAVATVAQEYSEIFEPEEVDDRPVRILSVPVHAPHGAISLVLQVRNLPGGLSMLDLDDHASALKKVASEVEHALVFLGSPS